MLLKNLFLTLMAGSFLLAALVNGLREQMANCIVGAVYGSVLIYVMWLMWRVPHVDMVFKRWMRWNEEAIRQGGAVYRNCRVTPETELVAYQLCVSYLISAARVWSPYYVKRSPQARCMCTVFTALTLIFGWWSLVGPLATIRTLSDSGWTTTAERVMAEPN